MRKINVDSYFHVINDFVGETFSFNFSVWHWFGVRLVNCLCIVFIVIIVLGLIFRFNIVSLFFFFCRFHSNESMSLVVKHRNWCSSFVFLLFFSPIIPLFSYSFRIKREYIQFVTRVWKSHNKRHASIQFM